MYSYVISDLEKKSLILKNQIFLFSIIFSIPEPNKTYCSPFRDDANPNCFFTLYNGKIIFIDWAETKVKIHRDIFTFTMDLYQFNFIEALNYLYNLLNGNEPIKYDIRFNEQNNKNIKKTNIKVKKRFFNKIDIKYWGQYHLTLTDITYTNGNFKIIPISKFSIADTIIIPKSISYAYLFDNGIKTYLPFSKKYKWRSNLTKNDIGISNKKKNTLYITKSVKDAVLLNKLKKDYLFFQSENSFPLIEILNNTILNYKKINILFDNDNTGRINSLILFYFIHNNYSQKVRQIFTPKEKDITDFSKKFGINSANEYLKNNELY